MIEPIFLTGNKVKLKFAKEIWGTYNFKWSNQKIEIPEIQADNTAEVANFSAKYAAEKLQKPVIVDDVGYYCKALNGFPGPYIKYIEKWFTSDDWLNLMKGKNDRSVEIVDVLSLCIPGEDPIAFETVVRAKLSESIDGKSNSPIDQIMIREGFKDVQANINFESVFEYWTKKLTNYHDIAKYIISLTDK